MDRRPQLTEPRPPHSAEQSAPPALAISTISRPIVELLYPAYSPAIGARHGHGRAGSAGHWRPWGTGSSTEKKPWLGLFFSSDVYITINHWGDILSNDVCLRGRFLLNCLFPSAFSPIVYLRTVRIFLRHLHRHTFVPLQRKLVEQRQRKPVGPSSEDPTYLS